MNSDARSAPGLAARACLLLCASAAPAFAAPAFSPAQYPLFLSPGLNPNILVMFDNSESMDGTMSGKVLSGNDPTTRSNIARNVLRDIVTTYRYKFNWGLGSFELNGSPGLYSTYGYFLGGAETMVYTNACTSIVDGVGVSDVIGVHAVIVGGVKTDVTGPLPCIANPEPANGFAYITFDRSGDDADVNDVFYTGYVGNQMYGIGVSGVSYHVYTNRDASTDWDTGNFSGDRNIITFSPTDAGWLPQASVSTRQLWVYRGWGYGNYITGKGIVNEAIVKSQTATAAEVTAEDAHYTSLMYLLGPEDNGGGATPNLKNAAFFTPLAGTLETSRKYFAGEGYTSPISATCQRNFVVLATDGNPTGRKSGSQYDPADWVNTYDAGTGLWTYGPAINDVFTEIDLLRATVKGGQKYDVQTYVIGMGDTVINPGSVAAFNEMARRGGTTTAYLGSNSEALTAAFQAVVAEITAKTSAASSVALNSGSWQTGSALYQAKFNSADWSGNLLAFPVGADGALGATPTWEAAAQINLQNWNTGRAILSYKPSAAVGVRGVAFRWPANPAAPTASELDASQVLALNTDAYATSDGYGQSRLDYLRGDASKEIRNCPACTPRFRDRAATVLGDIVNSSPFYVGAPSGGYYDDFESVAYSTFAETWRERQPYIYVGANDGMLHAINADTGEEKFAYVPNLVVPQLSKLTTSPYSHQYSVDGSPAVADVFYGGAWHTLLAAGLRAGGKGLFTLDVTDPSNFTEAGAGSVVRWEFTDADMGNIFAQPVLAKTNNGRWSVIVGNGYNDGGSHRAMLFVIDAETGVIVKKIDTGVGSAGSPNGLSGPAAIDVNGDGVVDTVYAGDLNGNLWKFELTDASPTAWGVAVGGVPLFTTPTRKAISGRPDVTRFPRGGYLVTFGTGQYMATSDIFNTDLQTGYGIWDKDGTAVTPAQLQEQLIETVTASAAGDTYRLSTHRVGTPTDSAIANDVPTITRDNYYATKRGWFVDLPDSGERIVADARIRGGRVVFTSLIPDTSTCAFGGSGWVLEFDVITGNRFDSATFDVNGDGMLSSADYLVFTGVGGTSGNNTSGWKIGAVPAAPGFMGFKNGNSNNEIKYVNTSDGTVVQKRETAGSGGEGRVMWRVVQ